MAEAVAHGDWPIKANSALESIVLMASFVYRPVGIFSRSGESSPQKALALRERLVPP